MICGGVLGRSREIRRVGKGVARVSLQLHLQIHNRRTIASSACLLHQFQHPKASFLYSPRPKGRFLKMFLGPINARATRKDVQLKVKEEYNNYRLIFSVFTMKTLTSSAPSTSWKTKANQIVEHQGIAENQPKMPKSHYMFYDPSMSSDHHVLQKSGVDFTTQVLGWVVMDMKVLKDVQELKQDVEELNITKDVDDGRVVEAKGESKLAGDIEELKIKLRKVEAKLNKVKIKEEDCRRKTNKMGKGILSLPTVGVGIVIRALSYPLKLIAKNSGDNGSVVMVR
ncbi:hypothetical protein IFM89_016229, partial [Coptis chinensis]